MKKRNKLILVLIGIWSLYGIWEYYVFEWAKTESTPVIRVDLFIIYPVLIILTLLLGYKIYYDFKRKQND